MIPFVFQYWNYGKEVEGKEHRNPIDVGMKEEK